MIGKKRLVQCGFFVPGVTTTFLNSRRILTVFLKEKLVPCGFRELDTQTLHITLAEVDLLISHIFRQFWTVFSKETPVPGAFRELRTLDLHITLTKVNDFKS